MLTLREQSFFSETSTRELMAAIDVAPNIDAAMDVLMSIGESLGFSRICYGYTPATRFHDGRWVPYPWVTRGYPKGWDRSWGKHCSHDPYYHNCFDGDLTIDWRTIQKRQDLTAEERDSWRYLADKQLYNGITIPIVLSGGRFAFVSALSDVSDDEWDELARSTQNALFVVAHQFHASSFKRFQDPFARNRPRDLMRRDLSRRELECLKWAALGKTAEEIATIIDRSAETVRIHLKRAGMKLSASNRAHAVAKACCMGLIDFPR